ncbi:MAG: cytochrome c oxidase subunit 3, partial [bacterium]
WWGAVVKESGSPGLHSAVVSLGLRYGMVLFIASEVMFFVAFFWAYFHFALFPEHVSGATRAIWPPAGVYTFDPWHLPLLNTLILLLSGTTVTWAHHALLEDDRKSFLTGLGLTVALGVFFTVLQ